jgi:hypothetical protein
MPRIFDNIEQQLFTTLQETLQVFNRADFYLGYFNLQMTYCIKNVYKNVGGGKSPI